MSPRGGRGHVATWRFWPCRHLEVVAMLPRGGRSHVAMWKFWPCRDVEVVAISPRGGCGTDGAGASAHVDGSPTVMENSIKKVFLIETFP